MIDEAKKQLGNERAEQKREFDKSQSKLRRFGVWCRTHKKRSVPSAVAIAIVLLSAIPVTRYNIAGLFVKRSVEVQVVDGQTKQPVSGADVSLRGKNAKTDGDGRAVLSGVKPGKANVIIRKTYYQDTTSPVTVRLNREPQSFQLEVTATGRQIPVRVTNKVTGNGVKGIKIIAGSTEAETDQDGEATVVVDALAAVVEADLSGEGYNGARVNLTPGPEVTANVFALTPAGKLYFLSKKTGNIDIAKTDLDGNNRETVLAGTGNEESASTVLLASRDWKFLALLARRDGAHASLYLIDTTTDKLTQIDTNDALFTLTGWSGHDFVYQSRSNTLADWQPKQTTLKSFSADTGKLTNVDETIATGTGYGDYVGESFTGVYVVDNQIVYAKNWLGNSLQTASKRPGIYSAKANGSEKKLVKDFNQSYLALIQSRPKEVYVQQSSDGTNVFYAFTESGLKDEPNLTPATFNQFYATYLQSPSGSKTFWYEPRDGKNTLMVGDGYGQNGKELLSVGEYVAYGWYSDDYVLLSRNGSELFIAPVKLGLSEYNLQKVTDYHKPAVNFLGYGGGYGGL